MTHTVKSVSVRVPLVASDRKIAQTDLSKETFDWLTISLEVELSPVMS